MKLQQNIRKYQIQYPGAEGGLPCKSGRGNHRKFEKKVSDALSPPYSMYISIA